MRFQGVTRAKTPSHKGNTPGLCEIESAGPFALSSATVCRRQLCRKLTRVGRAYSRAEQAGACSPPLAQHSQINIDCEDLILRAFTDQRISSTFGLGGPLAFIPGIPGGLRSGYDNGDATVEI